MHKVINVKLHLKCLGLLSCSSRFKLYDMMTSCKIHTCVKCMQVFHSLYHHISFMMENMKILCIFAHVFTLYMYEYV